MQWRRRQASKKGTKVRVNWLVRLVSVMPMSMARPGVVDVARAPPQAGDYKQVRAVSTRVRVGLDSGTLDPHSRASMLNPPARLNWLILT